MDAIFVKGAGTTNIYNNLFQYTNLINAPPGAIIYINTSSLTGAPKLQVNVYDNRFDSCLVNTAIIQNATDPLKQDTGYFYQNCFYRYGSSALYKLTPKDKLLLNCVQQRTVNVNIYGGVNPYNNAEWNDWNVNSSLNTTVLKYSDGTVSAMNAALSHGSQVSDNGATYSKSMTPAPVIRYTSHSTIARTLTLGGLSPSKLYDIEIYASRSYHTGESTIFSTGAESDTIATYHNNTKVIFSNVSPDVQQRIIININRLLTHNFINGFRIT